MLLFTGVAHSALQRHIGMCNGSISPYPHWPFSYAFDKDVLFYVCLLILCFGFLIHSPQYSLCSEPLIELSNSGASGSLFYVSSDDEFIIKTVQHKEAEFLQKLLPGYYMVSCLGDLSVWVVMMFLWQHRLDNIVITGRSRAVWQVNIWSQSHIFRGAEQW